MVNSYKKIASTARSGRLSSTAMSLWESPDHLLQVERDGYTESYRRFYFADVEAYTMRIDTRQRTIAVVISTIIGILWFIAILNTGFARGFFFGFGAVFLIPLLINWRRGPTCVVHLATAVQREEVGSVRRVKAAERLLESLRNATAQTQGTITPDLVRVKFELQNVPRPPTPPPLTQAGSPAGLPPLQ